MYYELYIDVFFLVNFMMDAILLEIVRKILKCPATHGRIFLGAAAGAFGTCAVILLPIPYASVKFIMFHGLINIIMLKTGLRTGWDRTLWKAFLLLYISGFLVGGILESLWPYTRTAGLFFAFAVVSYYGALGIFKLLKYLARQDHYRRQVVLYRGNRRCRITAVIDTGNSLRDGLSGKPVSIISRKTADSLGDWSQTQGIRWIPYHAVGTREGVLPMFPLDKMEVQGETVEVVEDPLVAVYEEISADDYEMLLNPDVL